MKYIGFLENLKLMVDATLLTFEEIALSTLARVVPWLVPVGPAYVIGRAIYHHLETGLQVAAIMAAGLEGMGVYVTHVTFLAWDWNNTKNESDPAAPFTLLKWLVASYLVIAGALSILLEFFPILTNFAPGAFVPLGVVTMTTVSAHIKIKRWQAAKDEAAALRRQEREAAFTSLKAAREEVDRLAAEGGRLGEQTEAARAQLEALRSEVQALRQARDQLRAQVEQARQAKLAASSPKAAPTPATSDEIEARREEVKKLHRQGMTQPDIAKELNISRSTVKRDLAAIGQQNGTGK